MPKPTNDHYHSWQGFLRKEYVHTKTWAAVIIAALFVIAQHWKASIH